MRSSFRTRHGSTHADYAKHPRGSARRNAMARRLRIARRNRGKYW